MKKITGLFLLIIILSLSAFADQVDSNSARLVARNFIATQNPGSQSLQATQLNLAYVCSTSDKSIINQAAAIPLFYVYNVKGGQGFVIVSADDDALPILGYSPTGTYTGYDMPVAFDKLLEKYKQEIKFIKQKKLKADENIADQWRMNLTGSYANNLSTNTVSPLLQTKWNQAPYYNDMCPYDASAGKRSVTGCAATAMAQVMKFWNSPAQGSGFHSYNHATYGTLSANFGSTTYNWTSMPNSVTSTNNAVATLMYHVGVSIEMNYSPTGSGAYIISSASAGQACCEYAFKTYFGYASTLQGLQRDNYADATWIQMLKTDLDAGRPILYAGFGQGGHAFVCDGYDASNNFHFNWGWGGLYDGYFNINSLNPGTGGTGSGAGTYNNGQQAIFGVKPSTGGGSGGNATLQINSSITVTPSPIQYATSFTVNVDIWNNGTSDFAGEFAAAVFNSQGVFIDFVETKTGISLPQGYHYTNGITFSTGGMVSVTPGDYTIGIFYRSTGGNWTIVPAGSYYNAVNVTVDGLPNDISLYDSIQPSPYPLVRGKTATIHTNIANFGSTTFNGDYMITMNNLDGSFVQTLGTKTGMTLASGYAYTGGLDFNVTSIDSAAGSYLLVVWDKPSGGSWEIVATYSSKKFINPIITKVVEGSLQGDIFEANNIESTAYNLPLSFTGNTAAVTTEGSNIHVGTDVDYYKVILPTGTNYSISARVHDSYKSGNGKTYTDDVVFSYNDGTGWSESFDDVMSSNIVMANGGTLMFYIVPRYIGNTGTYLLDLTVTKNSGGVITISAPVNGNTWNMGSSHNITWTDNITEDVKIELFKGLTNVKTINVSAPSNGSYLWLLPTDLAADVNYRIKISSTVDNNIFDYSPYFAIGNTSSSQITLTAPTAGTTWNTGTTQNITWTDNISDNVLIELYKGTSFLSNIIPSAPSNGSYSWAIPGTILTGNDYKIKITSIADNNISATSNYFTINNPTSISGNTGSSELVRFYPNPANTFLNIQIMDPVNFNHVKLLNALGETVLDQQVSDVLNTLDISALQPGIYFLTVTGSEHEVNYKFSIVR